MRAPNIALAELMSVANIQNQIKAQTVPKTITLVTMIIAPDIALAMKIIALFRLERGL